MHRILRRTVLIVVLAVGALSSILIKTTPAQGQQNTSTVYLSDINASKFPDISFSFRGYGTDNHALNTTNNFSVLEDDQPVTNPNFATNDSVPLSVIFLVDTGAYSPFSGDAPKNTLRNALQQFVKGNYFREGVDTVSVLRHDGDNVTEAVKATQHSSEFSAGVNKLSLGNGFNQTQTLQSLVSALNNLAPQSPNAATALVYVSRILDPAGPNLTRAQDVATRALHGNVRIYTLHLFSGSGDVASNDNYVQIMKKLAEVSGGRYIVLADTPNGQADLTSQVYDQIVAQRVRFNVSFRSHSGNLKDHLISVVLGTGGATDANSKTYSVNLAPPTVNISSPNNNAMIDRNATRDASGQNWTFDVASTHIVGNVVFPDNMPRTIVSADLRIDNNVIMTIANPGTHIDFPWDISDIKSKGDNPRVVQIVVKDELGLESIPGKINLNIRVSIPEAVVSQTNVTVVKDVCEQDTNSLACLQERVVRYLPLIGLGVTLILLVLTRRQLSSVAGKAGGFIQTQVGEIRKTLLGARGANRRVLAQLLVQDGPENLIGKNIEIYNDTTSIGRDPERAEITFYKPDTRCSISGRHCTIYHQNGHFSLMDDGSANGTKINGRLIEPRQPVSLNDGDGIELGDLSRSGALLKFTTVEGAASDGIVDIGGTFFPSEEVGVGMSDATESVPYDEGKTLRDFPVVISAEEPPQPQKSKSNAKKKLLDDNQDWMNDL